MPAKTSPGGILGHLEDRALQAPVEQAPDDATDHVGDGRAQGHADGRAMGLRADVVADVKPGGRPGKDEEEPEDLDEEHRLSDRLGCVSGFDVHGDHLNVLGPPARSEGVPDRPPSP